MLKKVLRYDFKSIFKYWWIGAIASLALSLLGSVGLNFMNSEKALPVPVEIFSVIVVVLSCFGYAAFFLLSQILIFVRYYKNFYSDEGYLTFTLPVKRNKLLNSKLICGAVTTALTELICVISAGIMVCIGFRKQIFTKQTYEFILEIINEMFKTKLDVALFGIGIVEVIIFVLATTLLSCLFMYICICVGATISKKAKVTSAIAIYCAATIVSTFMLQMFTIFVLNAMDNWICKFTTNTEIYTILLLVMLTVILFVSVIITAFYSIHYTLLDKKLNLN